MESDNQPASNDDPRHESHKRVEHDPHAIVDTVSRVNEARDLGRKEAIAQALAWIESKFEVYDIGELTRELTAWFGDKQCSPTHVLVPVELLRDAEEWGRVGHGSEGTTIVLRLAALLPSTPREEVPRHIRDARDRGNEKQPANIKTRLAETGEPTHVRVPVELLRRASEAMKTATAVDCEVSAHWGLIRALAVLLPSPPPEVIKAAQAEFQEVCDKPPVAGTLVGGDLASTPSTPPQGECGSRTGEINQHLCELPYGHAGDHRHTYGPNSVVKWPKVEAVI